MTEKGDETTMKKLRSDCILLGEECSVCEAPQLTDFQKRVYHTLCWVPSGFYTTYNAISKQLGSSPRAVGQALRRNPFNCDGAKPRVPCHRVVASDYFIGGFSGVWNAEHANGQRKQKMLREEGLGISEDATINPDFRAKFFVYPSVEGFKLVTSKSLGKNEKAKQLKMTRWVRKAGNRNVPAKEISKPSRASSRISARLVSFE